MAGRVVLDVLGVRVQLDDALEHLTAVVERDSDRDATIRLSGDTWETLSHDSRGETRLLLDLGHSDAVGTYRLPLDGAYLTAVLAQANQTQADVPAGLDRLRELATQAEALLVEAAGINARPSVPQQQMFLVRHASLVQQQQALAAELQRLTDTVELAGATVRGTLLT